MLHISDEDSVLCCTKVICLAMIGPMNEDDVFYAVKLVIHIILSFTANLAGVKFVSSFFL